MANAVVIDHRGEEYEFGDVHFRTDPETNNLELLDESGRAFGVFNERHWTGAIRHV